MRQRVGGHGRHHQASDDRPERPEAHRRPPPPLGREVPHQGRGGNEDDPLDEADQGDEDHEQSLVRGVGHGEDREQGGQREAVGDHVGPTPPVGHPGQDGRKGADPGRHHADGVDVIAERHAVVFDDRRRHRAGNVQLVVEDDRCQHDDPEVEDAGPGVRIVVERPEPDPPEWRPPPGSARVGAVGAGARLPGPRLTGRPLGAGHCPPSSPPRRGACSPDDRAPVEELEHVVVEEAPPGPRGRSRRGRPRTGQAGPDSPQGDRHGRWRYLPEPGRAFDVSEEERHRPRRTLHGIQLSTSGMQAARERLDPAFSPRCTTVL